MSKTFFMPAGNLWRPAGYDDTPPAAVQEVAHFINAAINRASELGIEVRVQGVRLEQVHCAYKMLGKP